MTKQIEERVALLERRQELLYKFARDGNRTTFLHHWKRSDAKTAGVLTASQNKQSAKAASMRDGELKARKTQEEHAADQAQQNAKTKAERVAAAFEGHKWIRHGQFLDRGGIIREVGYDPLDDKVREVK